ncbi:MAG: hypothetical protein NXH79_11680 [Rhodobacteraceae bacterium]|nr:hypothetical protein [Paracoccaceae bacterium]
MTRKPRVVRRIDFRLLPRPGTVLMLDGQRYIVVGSDLHIRTDGETVPIILWQSRCAECGQPFECRTGLKARALNRRCEEHRRPGKAATAAGRKRVGQHIARHGRRRRKAS